MWRERLLFRFVLWLAEKYHKKVNPNAWRSVIDMNGEYRIEISRRYT